MLMTERKAVAVTSRPDLSAPVYCAGAGADASVCQSPNSFPCGSLQVESQPMAGPASACLPPRQLRHTRGTCLDVIDREVRPRTALARLHVRDRRALLPANLRRRYSNGRGSPGTATQTKSPRTPDPAECRPPGSCARSHLATLPPRAAGHGDAAVSPYNARAARKLWSCPTPGHPAIFAHMIRSYEHGHAAWPAAAGQVRARSTSSSPPAAPRLQPRHRAGSQRHLRSRIRGRWPERDRSGRLLPGAIPEASGSSRRGAPAHAPGRLGRRQRQPSGQRPGRGGGEQRHQQGKVNRQVHLKSSRSARPRDPANHRASGAAVLVGARQAGNEPGQYRLPVGLAVQHLAIRRAASPGSSATGA